MQESRPLSRGSFVDPATDIPDNNHVNSKILLVYEEYSEMSAAQAILQKVGFDVLGISTEYTLSENVLSFNPDVVVAFGRGGKVTTVGAGRRLREMTRWGGQVILILPAGYKPNPQDFAKIRADMLLEAPVPALRLMHTIGKMLGFDEATLSDRLAKHGNELAEAPANGEFYVGSGAENEEAIRVTGAVAEDNAKTEVKSKFALDINSEAPKAKKEEQDLESLWKELTQNAELSITPEEEAAAAKTKLNKKVSFDLGDRQEEFTETELEALARDLQKAQNSEQDRVAKYSKFTSQVKDFDPRRSLSKMASRKVQRELTKSWNNKEIDDLDELRRGFTKALFRKK